MTVDAMKNKQRAAHILLVEDNHGDILLIKRAIKEMAIPHNLMVANTAEVAMNMLERQHEYTSLRIPDIILMDINLPGMNGHEALQLIRSNPSLSYIPVIILSSSRMDADVIKSYQFHANTHLVKPLYLEDLCALVKAIEQFWFTHAMVPDQKDIH